ncbi:MAG: hypothetical protein NC409_04005 [Clostridium sp.]|nr:hypothetical protein [Clostridium sp.]
MIFERINELCKQNNTTVSALCKEITGSSGNLPTWKKGIIKTPWLISICKKFNVSADFILALEESPTSQSLESEVQEYLRNPSEQNLLRLFRQLSTKDKAEIEELIEFKLERAKKENNSNAKSSILIDSQTG